MKRYDAWSEPDPQCGYGGARCELYERTLGQYVTFDDHERAVATLAAEVDPRDEVITRLLEMLLPGVAPPHDPCGCVECKRHEINEGRYRRALEISGRMK